MGRVFEKQAWADGDRVTPEEMAVEFNALFGEANGNIDRDNIDTAIVTSSKLAVGAVFREKFLTSNGTDNIIRSRNDDRQAWIVVPDTTATIVVGDGPVRIEAGLHYQAWEGSTPAHPWACGVDLGIFVDGELIARSDINSGDLEEDSLHLTAAPALGAGTRIFDLRIRIAPDLRSGEEATTHNVNIQDRVHHILVKVR